ncbi:four-carbon acid sugar kinase family protein [Nocardiopsis alba]|uniref:four-carbon acid sugar kinase family protein n=1 Tax=Nocardiopsis alba TaxID=53437 RepID=UPI0035E2EC34
MTTPRIAIVADDLTGAGDTAVQFVHAGHRTELRLTPAGGDADVVAITTDSRALPAEEASATVARAVHDLREAGVGLVYKKVDSTLRGPLRAEIDGALSAWTPDAVAVVCPAFPATGRVVQDGILLVDGVEVHRTAVGRDPVTPVTESHVAALLGAEHVVLTGDTAAEDAALLRAAGPVVVVDARTDEDLDRVAAAVVALGPDALPVGSAGLATRLARSWPPRTGLAPSLVMVTSLHGVAREQVARLADDPGTRLERPEPEDLADDLSWRRWSDTVLERFDIEAPRTVIVAPEDRGGSLSPEDVSRRLGALCSDIAERHEISGFVVTGGDGARALTSRLEAHAIRLTGEVAPGIPIGTLSGGPRHGLTIVTKAGGFGSPTALLDAAEAVRHTKGSNE